jgi:uncharacterized protein YjbI with pentapeptide repeats
MVSMQDDNLSQSESASTRENNKFDETRPVIVRWSLEEIVSAIEERCTSKGLDLSEQDLSGIDLSQEAVQRLLDDRGYRPGDPLPVWVSTYSARGARGLRLSEANLRASSFRYANLTGVELMRANLEGANLQDACLISVNLMGANMQHARLWRADMRHATASFANFRGASLYRVEFEDTEFLDADLTETLFTKADLSKVIVHRESFPDRLIYERPQKYAVLLTEDTPLLSESKRAREYLRYLEHGRSAYRQLKNSFLTNGMYRDASWAYYRERVVDKQMHFGRQVMFYFGKDIREKSLYSVRFLWLHTKHLFIWLFLWLEELSCGYGEKPWRALGLAVAIILLFSPIYYLSLGITDVEGRMLSWFDYLIYSMSTFATINLPRFNVINVTAELWTSLEALLGIATLALLMYSLGNRISRS